MLSALRAMADSLNDDGVPIIIHVVMVIEVKLDRTMRAVRIIAHNFISFSLGKYSIAHFFCAVKGLLEF